MAFDRKESEYSKKLRDPRWQRMRLRVFERDAFACQLCGSKTNTLNVHHARYLSGEPWDTAIELLFTACSECHGEEHENHKNELDNLLIALGEIGIRTSLDLATLTIGADQELHAIAAGRNRGDTTNPERVQAFANALLNFHEMKQRAIAAGEWFEPWRVDEDKASNNGS